MTNKISDMQALDYVQTTLRQQLEGYVGTVPDQNEIKETLTKTLKDLENQKIVCSSDTQNTKVEQLWKTWSIKQKLKWFTYNKLPILRESSEATRKAIDNYNDLAFKTEEFTGYYDPMEYPEHLITSPKSVLVTDVNLKLNTSIDFIVMDFTIGDK